MSCAGVFFYRYIIFFLSFCFSNTRDACFLICFIISKETSIFVVNRSLITCLGYICGTFVAFILYLLFLKYFMFVYTQLFNFNALFFKGIISIYNFFANLKIFFLTLFFSSATSVSFFLTNESFFLYFVGFVTFYIVCVFLAFRLIWADHTSFTVYYFTTWALFFITASFIFVMDYFPLLVLIIYVGAVVVLFLFIIMMIGEKIIKSSDMKILSGNLFILVFVLFFFLLLSFCFFSFFFYSPYFVESFESFKEEGVCVLNDPSAVHSHYFYSTISSRNQIYLLGLTFYDNFFFLFLFLGLLLFVSLIGIFFLTKRLVALYSMINIFFFVRISRVFTFYSLLEFFVSVFRFSRNCLYLFSVCYIFACIYFFFFFTWDIDIFSDYFLFFCFFYLFFSFFLPLLYRNLELFQDLAFYYDPAYSFFDWSFFFGSLILPVFFFILVILYIMFLRFVQYFRYFQYRLRRTNGRRRKVVSFFNLQLERHEISQKSRKFILFLQFVLIMFFFIGYFYLYVSKTPESVAMDTTVLVTFFSVSWSFNTLSLALCILVTLIFFIIYIYEGNYAKISDFSHYFIRYLCFSFLQLVLLILFLTNNLLVFFIAFEISVLPIYLILMKYGKRTRATFAGTSFLTYTLFCSSLFFISVISMWLDAATLTMSELIVWCNDSKMHDAESLRNIFFWFSFFLAFSAKLPLIPLHGWLLETHVEAPTSASMVLASLLLKMGIYGMFRIVIPFFPVVTQIMQIYVLSLCLLGFFYSTIMTIFQIDLKKGIAFTSISHMCMAIFMLFLGTPHSILSCLIMLFSHAFISAGSFCVVGALSDRFHSRLIKVYGGLTQNVPLLSFLVFYFSLGNVGFPLTPNFWSELTGLTSLYSTITTSYSFVIFCFFVSLFFSAVYNFVTLVKIIFFELKEIKTVFVDLTITELIVFFLLFGFSFILGIWPSNFYFCLIAEIAKLSSYFR